jgi:hypothetical protein
MSEQVKITVHIEYTHDCGQVFEEISYMKADQDLLLKLFQEALNWDVGNVQSLFVPPSLPPLPKLSLAGHVERVEMTGSEWRQGKGGLVCQKCGANLLFPSQDEEQE